MRNSDTVCLLQALIEAMGCCYGQKQRHKGRTGALWASAEGWRELEVPLQWDILTVAQKMLAHYVKWGSLWFLSGAVSAYQSCPVSQSCPGFPLLALNLCCAPCAVLSRIRAPVLSSGFPKLGCATDIQVRENEGTLLMPGPATRLVELSNKWSAIAPGTEKICRKDKI